MCSGGPVFLLLCGAAVLMGTSAELWCLPAQAVCCMPTCLPCWRWLFSSSGPSQTLEQKRGDQSCAGCTIRCWLIACLAAHNGAVHRNACRLHASASGCRPVLQASFRGLVIPLQTILLRSAILRCRLTCYALLPLAGNPWVVLPVELLHGVTFGCSWAAGTVNCARISPPGLKSTTQVRLARRSQNPPVMLGAVYVCWHCSMPADCLQIASSAL